MYSSLLNSTPLSLAPYSMLSATTYIQATIEIRCYLLGILVSILYFIGHMDFFSNPFLRSIYAPFSVDCVCDGAATAAAEVKQARTAYSYRIHSPTK